MNGQFKTSNFNHINLRNFINELQEKDSSIIATWKKNTKKLTNETEAANTLILAVDGKWFFKQIKAKGFVRFSHLTTLQEELIIDLLKKYQFYTEPNWGLSIGLIAVYLVLEYYISSIQPISWFMPFIMSCCGFVILFLLISYLRANEKVPENIYKFSMVFGIPAYLLTAIGSLLALPMYINISRYYVILKLFGETDNG